MTASGNIHDTPMGRVEAYLTGLGVESGHHARLLKRVAASQPATHHQAMDALYRILVEDAGTSADDQALAAARIRQAFPDLAERRHAEDGGYRGASMPPPERGCMLPAVIDRRPWRFLARFFPGIERRRLRLPRSRPTRLRRVARLRQFVLFFLIAIPAVCATLYMVTVLPHKGGTFLEIAILGFGALLFSWILSGFWTAMAGFFVLCCGDRYRVTADGPPDIDDARTAIVMPIHEEEVGRTFAGVQAVYESLRATGRLDEFDFFVLSDSTHPDTIAAEERAWADMVKSLGASDRLFYRRRRARVKRKSGNLADFCRRWGEQYKYMIVLDADSIMTGSTMTALVDRMQANPDVGLIQTPPTAVNRSSFLARVQQFATRLYGPMFAAGLHYWHLDNAYYWGHNAIIRVAPFMAHCALPRLPGRGALSGEILSHDFVEAALMGRAGWGVFIAYDLPGSYEEVPPTLIEELGRDRRWCQGNIQHLRMLFSDHLSPAHRALFANGVMAYTSAAFWFIFLALSSTEAVLEALKVPDYFPTPGALFPSWPVWRPIWAVSLFCGTLVVLFLPKVVGMAMVIARGEAQDFGGAARIVYSTLIEVVLTSLLAPVRMLSHTFFVFCTLIGFQVKWNTQQRADATVPWLAALRFHLPGMVLAAAWGAVLYVYTPGFFPWLLPVLLPLFIAPVLTVCTSQTRIGLWLRDKGVQVIPEERRAPVELVRVAEIRDHMAQADFIDLMIDPSLSALHIGLQGRPRRLSLELAEHRDELARRIFVDGPDSLTLAEQRSLLADPRRMDWLHRALWMMDQPPTWAAERIDTYRTVLTGDSWQLYSSSCDSLRSGT